MKFTFKNIGPVKKAELELGNLTIIAGRNNTGKSYIAHTLYNFWASLYSRIFISSLVSDALIDEIAKVAGLYKKMREASGKVTVSQKDAELFFVSAMKRFAKEFSEDLHAHFAADDDDFAAAVFSCNGFVFPTESKGYKPYQKNNIASFLLKNGRFDIKAQNTPNRRDILLGGDLSIAKKASAKKPAAKEIVLFYMTGFAVMPATIFSAERMSIPTFYKELDISKNNYIEMLQKSSNKKGARDAGQALRAILSNSARYRQPIRDNIDFTRDVELIQTTKGKFADGKLIDAIKNIVGGHYLYAKNQILFIPKPNGGGKKAIPLHSASSSVQCFALLYFYLQHVAKEGRLLIVDEPEAHLDTVNQIKLARLLARCANAGIKVVITTHSDYLVKEINNLIMLSYKPLKHKAELLKAIKHDEGDEIKKEDVKAYICEKGGLTPCDIDARGMDMPVFDKTIDDINSAARTLTLHLPENA